MSNFSKNKRSFLDLIFLIALFYGLDQLTKYWVRLSAGPFPQEIFFWLSFVKMWNKGICFGLFHDIPFMRKVFLVLPPCISLGFVVRYMASPSVSSLWSTGLIVGGALGNLKDRIDYGGVFDFIYMHWNIFYFPAFNLADLWITLGVLIIFLNHFFFPEKKRGFV